MAATETITFTMAPLPTGTAADANAYAQLIASGLRATLSGNFLTGQIDGTPPTQNIGVWLNQGVWYVWDPNSNSYVPQTVSTNPAGVILMYAGTVAPSGYLFCDGTLYLRSAFPALYAAIGDVWGTNDGVSTFRVPDYRSRVPIGAVTPIGSSGLTPGLTLRSLGATFGEETHTLSINELASHTHGLSSHTHTMGNHTHLGVDHLHSMQGHTHLGVDHLHDLQGHSHAVTGVNHLHDLQGHTHAVTGVDHTHSMQGHTHGYTSSSAANTTGNISTGGFPFTFSFSQAASNTGGPNIGNTAGSDRSLATGTGGPGPNNTGAADRSLATSTAGPSPNNTGAMDRGATTGGPSTPLTGAADRGLTTGGPSTNTSDGPNTNTSGAMGGGAVHNNIQPSMACGFIIKT